MSDPAEAEDLLDVPGDERVELGVTRTAEVELLPPPIHAIDAHRVTDGFSVELDDGRTLFVPQSMLDAATHAASSRR